MVRLIYTAITSLDGYIADTAGNFDWAVPDEEVHAFVNELERPIGTYLYGRRLYETMAAWESMDTSDSSPAVREFAQLWRAADKVVFSRTLETVTTTRTRLERSFDPAVVLAAKSTAERDLTIGGAELAGSALRNGLVDELNLLLVPVAVGGGTSALPTDLRVDYDFVDERHFRSGFVHLRYRTRH